MDFARIDHDGVQIVPGNVEKFIDQLFQPVGFVQGDADVLFPEFLGQRGRFVQQAEITDHGGQRGFQIMGQVGDEIVLLPGFLGKQPFFFQGSFPQLPDQKTDGGKFTGKQRKVRICLFQIGGKLAG